MPQLSRPSPFRAYRLSALVLLSTLVSCRPAPQTSAVPALGTPSRPALKLQKAAETKPAAPQPTGLQLLWSVPEPVLRDGQISRPLVHRSLTLPLGAAQLAEVRTTGKADGLRPALNRLYAELEARQPRDIRFTRQGKGWAGQAQTGWKVDRAATEAAVLQALKRGESRSALTVKLVAPARSVAWAAAEGMNHLATGESSFTGSPEFRVHNVRVGASRVHGVWVAPGTDFDFNASVGPVSASTGFQPGYVVTGNTLSVEDGGGLCQVSTTVFRAAFRAGLPVTERHSHSYQVGYYGAPGLDAAVYAPSKNLRWRNTTGHPLLVQAEWDIRAARLSIHLFGRPDGRQVQISQPKLSGARLLPPPTFIADPKMAPGTVRRIDMPAAGAQVSVVRQINFPDGRTQRETLSSSYRAWGGVFAVPKGDSRLN